MPRTMHFSSPLLVFVSGFFCAKCQKGDANENVTCGRAKGGGVHAPLCVRDVMRMMRIVHAVGAWAKEQ